MKRLLISVLLVATARMTVATAQLLTGGQTPSERPFTILKLDPALDTVIDAGASPELLGDRFGLTEGAVWVQQGPQGFLLFSDMLDNVIYRWEPVGSSRVDLQACKLEYSIVSPK